MIPLTVAELARKARRVYPNFEIVRAVQYKNTVTFYFENPEGKTQVERALLDGDVSFDTNGKRVFVNLNDTKIWKDLVEIPESEWSEKKSLEHSGRKGMKWYQHIFGREDPRGKYNSHASGTGTAGMGMRLDHSPKRDVSGSLFGLPVADFAYRDINKGRFGQSPFSDEDSVDYSHNCVYCSVAYDLNRRGFNVSAAPSGGMSALDIGKFYKGGKDRIKICDTDELGDLGSEEANQQRNMETMRQTIFGYPPGSRGILCCQGFGRGHAMAWERRSDDGFTVIDGQTGENVGGQDWNYWKGAGWFTVLRTDDLDVDDDTIDEAIDSYEDKEGHRWSDESFNDILEHCMGKAFVLQHID